MADGGFGDKQEAGFVGGIVEIVREGLAMQSVDVHPKVIKV